ncbi:hypothetical protein SAMN05216550_12314 [Paraburkholderia tropica]|uniref:Uncharacterized protein n=1 Tax=Paraburkholderia tropica TaxID=92647 RepID=A0AAQ1GMW3_9BURK|nr:hypothetical protein SAMN05216550_12314 [Paraburkholderia tropica]
MRRGQWRAGHAGPVAVPPRNHARRLTFAVSRRDFTHLIGDSAPLRLELAVAGACVNRTPIAPPLAAPRDTMACMFCAVLFALENCRAIDSARFRLKLNRPTNRWIPDRFAAAPEDDVHARPFAIALPISSAVSNRWDQPHRNPSRVGRTRGSPGLLMGDLPDCSPLILSGQMQSQVSKSDSRFADPRRTPQRECRLCPNNATSARARPRAYGRAGAVMSRCSTDSCASRLVKLCGARTRHDPSRRP